MSAQPTSEDVVATPRATRNTSNSPDYSILNREEVVWRDLQPWLEERGYMLRPRYRVGWVPKWKGTKILSLDHEDAHRIAVRSFHASSRVQNG